MFKDYKLVNNKIYQSIKVTKPKKRHHKDKPVKKINFLKLISVEKIINFILIIVSIIGIWFVGNKLYDFAFETSYFILKDKRVENLKYIPKNYFYSMIDNFFKEKGYKNNPNILKINLKELESYILKHCNRIQYVNITKSLPSILKFKVQEKIPVAIIKNNNKFILVDKDGNLFDIIPEEVLDFPLISGVEKFIKNNKYLENDLLYVFDFLTLLRSDEKDLISEIYINNEDEIEILPRYIPVRVKLGKEDVVNKFRTMKDYIEKLNIKNIEYVDLRFSKPVISFKTSN